jgi:hypothetical protein
MNIDRVHGVCPSPELPSAQKKGIGEFCSGKTPCGLLCISWTYSYRNKSVGCGDKLQPIETFDFGRCDTCEHKFICWTTLIIK